MLVYRPDLVKMLLPLALQIHHLLLVLLPHTIQKLVVTDLLELMVLREIVEGLPLLSLDLLDHGLELGLLALELVDLRLQRGQLFLVVEGAVLGLHLLLEKRLLELLYLRKDNMGNQIVLMNLGLQNLDQLVVFKLVFNEFLAVFLECLLNFLEAVVLRRLNTYVYVFMRTNLEFFRVLG